MYVASGVDVKREPVKVAGRTRAVQETKMYSTSDVNVKAKIKRERTKRSRDWDLSDFQQSM